LDNAERDYIQVYNAKVKHNEPTTALAVPANLKIVRRKPSANVISPVEDEKKDDDDSSDSDTEQTRPKNDRKKIRFNLNKRDSKS